jgi:hypothetical protein
MIKWIFAATLFVAAYGQQRPIVSTTTGQLQGISMSTGILQPNYFAFKGVPYAGLVQVWFGSGLVFVNRFFNSLRRAASRKFKIPKHRSTPWLVGSS